MSAPGLHAAAGARRGRVAILTGCAQSVLDPGINEAAIRLLTRLRRRGRGARGRSLLRLAGPSYGPRGGRARSGAPQCRRVDARASRTAVSTRSSSPRRAAARRSRTMASCCASIRPMREKAARISALARDVTEYLAALDLPEPAAQPGPCGRLSFRLLDAARPEDHAPAEGTACQGRLCRQGAARGASVLRLGRHLQHHAARDRRCNCATAR